MDAAGALARELLLLIRTLRDLNGAAQPGPAVEQSTAAILGRVGDEGPMRLSALAERLCLDLSTVSRQVPVLERAGWLVRETDAQDRRAQLLRLTDAGRQVLAERRVAQAQLLETALPSWSSEEVAALAASLTRLNADLTAYRATAAGAPTHSTLQQEAS